MAVRVIGYGSLIDEGSVRVTCPGGRVVGAVWVDGWRRHMQTPAVRHLGGAGRYSVMDVVAEPGARFNGVVVDVPDDEFAAMVERERQYRLVAVAYRAWSDGVGADTAQMWVADGERMAANWAHPQQAKYLQLCLRGCVALGDSFLNDFLATTEVDGVWLADHPALTGWVAAAREELDAEA